MQNVKIGILVSSDRASRGEYEDISGKAIQEVLGEFILNPCEFFYEVVSDDFAPLQESMKRMCDELHCDLLVTTGGTGPAPRDIIPEVTESLCEKMLPGFGELMRQVSLKYVPTAILSRQSAGIRGKTLILNLPGKPKSIRECLEAVFPAIPYCIDLIGGAYIEANTQNTSAFRPKS
ncbi:molybdopterin adenylyltransferase [Helicobacter sp. MIT 00-7814]|uniref:molybdopterin adenylyltransferase n=1 Tax=unclassified Helicobacter TaxID=2593540 RepID=UPI000E1F92AD|nr:MULTISPECIES: molybdopterin adenylyltransferase [unclassified Helicobacter]RDU51820.1 molybdopterin adenylyltransferase [Helicobacter sp. MIT 99-10781]RDU51833.1 molybdopterin adenylyltransferase [Helicobacter sp. MIT 00-7814]